MAAEEALKRVLFAGGTSTMGQTFIKQLLKHPHGFEVGVLTRASSSQDEAKRAALESLTAAGCKVVEADYSTTDTLVSSLKGWDVAVSVLGRESLSQQEVLIQAAAKAGIKRLLPSEWGMDLCKVGRGAHPVYDRKLRVQQLLRDAGVPYTIVACGLFMELLNARLLAAAEEGGRLLVCGSGDVPFSAMCWQDIGALLGDILLDRATANSTVALNGASLTWNQAVADYASVTGRSVRAQHVSSWLVYAKRAVTRNEEASFPLAVGLLLDKGQGDLSRFAWNEQPGKTQHKCLSFGEFVKQKQAQAQAQ